MQDKASYPSTTGDSIVIVTRHFKDDFTVDPLDGDIRIFYDDRRNDSDMDGTGPDKENEHISVYMSASRTLGIAPPGGVPFPHEREVRCRVGSTDEGFQADNFIGDYNHAASRSGSSIVVWTDRILLSGSTFEEILPASANDP